MAFFKRLLRQKELVLLLLIGLMLIFISDTLLVESFRKDQEYSDRVKVEQLKAQMQSALEEHVTALIALKVVYQNFTDINHYDFQQYGSSITSTLHGFNRLLYIDPKMTIRQVYPNTPENRGLYNYVLPDNSAFSQVLKAANSPTHPPISRLVPLLNNTNGFWAIIPVYRGKTFLGYAAGELAVDRIWKNLSPLFTRYQMQLLDPQDVRYFPQINLDRHSENVQRGDFDLAGQKGWTVLLRPLTSTMEKLLYFRACLWLGGLLILFLSMKIISSSKKHKSQLNEAHQQFETIFEASPDGILLLDEKLHLQISNPVVTEWLGKSRETLADKTFFDLFACQCPNLSKCSELSHLLCTSKEFTTNLPDILETHMIDPPEGSARVLRLNASRIALEKSGKTQKGFICVLGDISTSKELDRVKETYVATLTHDLKTPLLAQQLVLDTLSAGRIGPVNDEQLRLLIGARESVQDLVDMVNSTLLFYKLESSHVTLHRYRADITNIIRDIMTTLQPLAEKRQLTLALEVASELPPVSIDAVQMKRVIHNLLSNAISYSRANTQVRISIQMDADASAGERLLLEFYNEGKGITAEELPKIFDKYHSISRKFKQIGTGLGLYISRKIVELHGGKIWAVSRPEHETRFFISLPCLQEVESLRQIEARKPAISEIPTS